MYYEDLVGYGVAAPQFAARGYQIGNNVPPPSPAGAVGNVGTFVGTAPATSFGASGSFAVAGWLAAIILLGVVYRVVWERAG